MKKFRFSVGPWNISEGADTFGPNVRTPLKTQEKFKLFKSTGIDAIQFHDDDVVNDIAGKSAGQIEKESLEIKKILEDLDLKPEFVAPRLWEDARTIDGALTSNNPADREYALTRIKQAIDIARFLDCPMIGFWFAREGTLCYESKDPVVSWQRLREGIDAALAYDSEIKIFIEPKPNEPVDRSICPTMGHAMALSMQTMDPARVGGLVESAHAILAGLDPANEMACALAFDKLFGVHLNDQNGLKFDQDKAFGAENLRQAFNQVKLLMDNQYGSKGEYIGLDVKAMRTQKDGQAWKHIKNSMTMVKILQEKVQKFEEDKAGQLIADRDYEELEMYILQLLLSH